MQKISHCLLITSAQMIRILLAEKGPMTYGEIKKELPFSHLGLVLSHLKFHNWIRSTGSYEHATFTINPK